MSLLLSIPISSFFWALSSTNPAADAIAADPQQNDDSAASGGEKRWEGKEIGHDTSPSE